MNKKILRKFGFIGDQNGFINRYLRETEGWKIHLERTKDFILKSAQNKSKSKVCILGSGWLVDVPYHELSSIFKEIVLVDMVHPRQITHKFRQSPNFIFVEADITGLLEPVYNMIKLSRKKYSNDDLVNLEPVYNEILSKHLCDSDYVVSVNLFNQLDIVMCDYIEKSKKYDLEKLQIFKKLIQSNHLDLLPKGKSVLITDYEEINLDNKNQIVNRKKLIHATFPDDKPVERWTWDFDLQKTYRKNLKTIFKVMAIEL